MSVSVMNGGVAYPLAGAQIFRDGEWHTITPTDEAAGGGRFYIVGGNNALCSRGTNDSGQLGTGDFDSHNPLTVNYDPAATGYERMMVVNLFNCTKVAINTTMAHSLAIADGKLYEFGNRPISGPATQPTLSSTETGWTDAAATARVYTTEGQSYNKGYSMGILNGELYSWGFDVAYSDFENNPLVGHSIRKISTLTGWTSVSCNGRRAAGICNGALYTWGLDGERIGQAGTDTPTQIGSLTGWTFARVTDYAIFAIRSGQLFAVGQNNTGQLGMGDTTDHGTTFVRVGALTGWTFVGEATNHMGVGICDGGLMIWRAANGYVPTAVPGAAGFVKAVRKGSNSSTGINPYYLLGSDGGLYHLDAAYNSETEVWEPAIVSNHDNHEWLDIAGDNSGYLLAIRKS